MDKTTSLLESVPFVVFLGYGVYSILEVIFPALRGPDFREWEIDEDSGTSVQILGWKKALSPPRVLASGYLTLRTACAVAIGIGVIFISIGVFGIRYTTGTPIWIPDLFERFLH